VPSFPFRRRPKGLNTGESRVNFGSQKGLSAMFARASGAVLILMTIGGASAQDVPFACRDAERPGTGPIVAIELYSLCLAEPGLAGDRAAQVRYRRALAYQTNNQMMEAATDLREALRLRPQWADAERARGLVMMAINEFDQAEEHLTAALRIDPDFAAARKDRAALRASLGDLTGAKDDIKWALRAKPVFPEAYLELGLVHT
jgi:tetratricopeptide (TPR) repeat protein